MEDNLRQYLPTENETDITCDDWRKFKTDDGHSKRFEYLLESKLWTDVTFIVGTVKQEFKVHKLILRTGSKVFDDLFMKNNEISSFEIPDVDPAAFDLLLRYLYTGEYADSLAEPYILFIAASKYQVSDLVQICGKKLSHTVTYETALQMYRLAKEHEAEYLKQTALKCISRLCKRFLKSAQFLQINVDELGDILKRDDLRIQNEEELFEAVLNWSRAECKRKILDESGKSLRSVLENVVPLIRFRQMDSTYFALNVVPTNVLLNDEVVSILQYFAVEKSKKALIPVGAFNPDPRSAVALAPKAFVLQRLVHKPASEVIDLSTNKIAEGLFTNPASEEKIQLKSSVPVWVSSIGMNIIHSFYDMGSIEIEVRIQLMDNGTVIAQNQKTLLYKRNSIFYRKVNHFMFDEPVHLQEDKWYTASFKVTSMVAKNIGFQPHENLHVEKFIPFDGDGTSLKYYLKDLFRGEWITFEFQNSENTRFTSVSQGFIPEIGFIVD